MKSLRIILLCLFLLPLLSPSAVAQNEASLLYGLDYLAYFDNREYDADFQRSQTFFGSRLSPEIGWQLQDDKRSHAVKLGLHYTQPIGRRVQADDIQPIIYYQSRSASQGWNLYMGCFPYKYLSEELPSYVLYDSIAYAQPNIQGALLQWKNDAAFLDVVCDWRSQQTEYQREAFRLLLNTRYQWAHFHVGALAQLNHLASRKFQKNGVCDDAFIHPQVGIRLPLLDEFNFSAGYLFAYQWDRLHMSSPALSHACLIDLRARWKFLTFDNQLYIGSGLQTLYPKYGAALYQGDPFYQSACYHRSDISVYLWQHQSVQCLFSWNVHYTKEYGLDHQQQLICRFTTDGLKQSKTFKTLFGK